MIDGEGRTVEDAHRHQPVFPDDQGKVTPEELDDLNLPPPITENLFRASSAPCWHGTQRKR